MQPIKDRDKIIALKRELLKRNYKYYLVSVFALNTGLRISDIIKLKVIDVRGKNHITLREGKTNKNKMFPINNQLRDEINKYIIGMNDDEYLFPSRQKNSGGIKSHITRIQAYRFIKGIAEELDIDHFGMHSFRKTFGFFFYYETKDLAKLM